MTLVNLAQDGKPAVPRQIVYPFRPYLLGFTVELPHENIHLQKLSKADATTPDYPTPLGLSWFRNRRAKGGVRS